jgi:hypothetical protein
MARGDDSDSRPLGTTAQRVHFGGHRNTCRCALFSREKVNQISSSVLGLFHPGVKLSFCHLPSCRLSVAERSLRVYLGQLAPGRGHVPVNPVPLPL